MMPPTAGNLLALTLQAGVLVLVGAPLPRLLGIRSPRARLAYFRSLLFACLLLPFLQPWVPAPLADAPEAARAPAVTVDAAPGDVAADALPGDDRLPRVPLATIVVAGTALRLAWLALGLVALRRLRRRSTLLEPQPPAVRNAAALAGAGAEFRVADRAISPVTFGMITPVVLVPIDFASFEAEQQKAIACHELIHVRRRDWLRSLGDEVVRAVAWFHPAAWWLTAQIRLSREQVVDQEAVARLETRKPYLDALLRLASSERRPHLVPAALFLGRTHLAERVSLLLKEVRMSRPRLALSFLGMALLLFVTGRTIVAAVPLHGAASAPPDTQQALGAPRPGQPTQPPAVPRKEAGPRRIHDVRPAFAADAPDGVLIVELALDGTGSVADAKVIAGGAEPTAAALEAVKQWKFAATGAPARILVGFNAGASPELGDQPAVRVGKSVPPPVKIHDVKPVYPAGALAAGIQGVVILEARIAADGAVAEAMVLRSVPMLDPAALGAVLQWKFAAPGFPVQMTVTVNFRLDDGPAGGVKGAVKGGVPGGVGGGTGVGSGSGSGAGSGSGSAAAALRVGTNLPPPQKTKDVKPIYPKAALDARVQGLVLIETTIGPDGKVVDAQILRSVPELDDAALEAVRQWEFTPTLLNGKAVTVVMTVTVNFTLQ